MRFQSLWETSGPRFVNFEAGLHFGQTLAGYSFMFISLFAEDGLLGIDHPQMNAQLLGFVGLTPSFHV